MDQRVVEELRAALTGRFFGKIFQLTPLSFAFDFGLRGEYLFISVDPVSPRLYLIRRRLKDLEKQSIPPNSFGQTMRSKLSGAHVVAILKDPLDRIVRVTLRIDDEPKGAIFRRLIIQLTGRTADLFLLDELHRIEVVLREGSARLGEQYEPPPRPAKETRQDLPGDPGSPSAQLDEYFAALDAKKQFDSQAKALRSKLTKSIRQQQTLKEHLKQDLVRHGDPDEHKRTGDLLLANIVTAVRDGKQSSDHRLLQRRRSDS